MRVERRDTVGAEALGNGLAMIDRLREYRTSLISEAVTDTFKVSA